MKNKEIYFAPLFNDKYGVFAKTESRLKDKLILVCNRAFNADVIARVLSADENKECVRLDEIEKI